MENFQYLKEQLKAEYKSKLIALEHWEKTCKEFKKKQQRNVDSFAMEFPHTNHCNDRNKIEKYAREFGFEIVDAESTLLNTTYIFKRKEDHK